MKKVGKEIPFESTRACNIRELGGYQTTDGKVVKEGILYRGIPTGLLMISSDMERFESFHLHTILDLRGAIELKMSPDWVPQGVKYINVCGLPNSNDDDLSPEGMRDMMEKMKSIKNQNALLDGLYEALPFDNKAYRKAFELLLNQQVPLYFHCSAGKDRTGMLAILILLVLGVDEQTALDDYVLTNVYRQKEIDRIINERPSFYEENPVEKKHLYINQTVDVNNAKKSLVLMKEKYGSYENYFLQEFGMDEKQIEYLRQLYLR